MEKKTDSQPEVFGTYGDDVFSEKVIARLLPKKVAEKLLATMRDSKPLDPKIADDVAEAMKRWALSKGATHFTAFRVRIWLVIGIEWSPFRLK